MKIVVARKATVRCPSAHWIELVLRAPPAARHGAGEARCGNSDYIRE
jgi:hypothetical protein